MRAAISSMAEGRTLTDTPPFNQPPAPPPAQPLSERPLAESATRESDRICDQQVTVEQLRDLMRQFVRERNWEKFHNAKNLSMSLAIEVGELLEHFQWLTTEEVVSQQGLDRQGIADELADVLCYALSLANALDIDIAQAVYHKMNKNRSKYPL